MKLNIVIIFLFVILFIVCKEEVKKEELVVEIFKEIIIVFIDNDVFENVVIYEVNIC